ncbi:threonine aldolase [Parvibaculum indicum]|uniref:threonine aldolase family protein n=1 Tax=Parvibaculum indicum TaxID=562969 RepID=UPI00141ED87F|nr:low specificity L-threonine aldolase [Parvibaculum indicum]NIJ40583.1 threonine aldolase [Parvibaculum indicum]
MDFTSDNAWGVAPEIMAALAEANRGSAASYGADDATARLQAVMADLFEHEVEVFPVATGTAANALALACLTPPWGAVFCHELAHAHIDECGAPEFFADGAKFVPIAGENGKLEPDSFKSAFRLLPLGNVHNVQPSTLTLTQSTECGTLYSLDEIRALTDIAHSRDIAVHMDGARFANAVAALDVSPAEITWKSGIDVMSFGATKNGAMAAEAVIFFDKHLARDFAFRRKRGGHLFSKMRFLSAQLEAYLKDGLWLRLAAHANAMARELAEGLGAMPGVDIHFPVQANEIFVRMPVSMSKGLKEAGARFHPWPMVGDNDQARTVRLVTSFQTEAEAVAEFLAHARAAAG